MPRFTKKPTKRGLPARSPKRTSSIRKPVSSAPKKQNKYAPGPTTKAPQRRPVGPTRTGYARARSGGGISLWFKVLRALSIKYHGWFLAGYITLGVLLLVGAFFLFFFKDGSVTFAKAEPTPSPSVMLTEADDPYAQNYTEEELAGLSGENLDSTEYTDLLEKDKVSIGVFIGAVTPKQELSLRKLDEAIDAEYANATVNGIYKYYSSNESKDDFNAQIQGIRSLANRDVNAVVVCINEEEEYSTIVKMAKEANMRVVAVDAPVDYGYDINIVTDDNDYGVSVADFVASHLDGRANIAEFIDTTEDADNKARLSAFNSRVNEYSNLNLLSPVDVGSGKSVSSGMGSLLSQATIEAIYTDPGFAADVLNECISRETLPKVFIGDATTEFIKLWQTLMTTGVDIEVKVDPEDRHSETITRTVQGTGMQVYVRPTPEGAPATAVKFAIRLAEGKTLSTDMLTDNKVYYYTGSVAVTDRVLSYYYNIVKDKEDDFVLNDWVSDYEVDRYFENSGNSYYAQANDELAAPEPSASGSPESRPSASPESSPEASASPSASPSAE